MAELTPMLKQYKEIKDQHQNELLFFRLGDFYELFGDDAKIASEILNIVLTARHKGSPNEMPMCGVPHHALENYLAKLLKAGQRVAICDQVSDASLPGIVKRQVTQVVTPGTTLVDATLQNKSNNYIASLFWQKNIWGLAIADLATGEFQTTQISDFSLLKSEIFRFNFSEVIVPNSVFNNANYKEFISSLKNVNVYNLSPFKKADEILLKHFRVLNLQSFGLENLNCAIEASGLLLNYLQETQKTELKHITKIKRYNWQDFMVLDEATIRNLELFQLSSTGEYQGSLLSIIDKTVTNMGGRLLRRYVMLPLLQIEKIEQRHLAVAELKQDLNLIKKITEKLKQLSDLERLVGRLGCRRGNARDLVALKRSFESLPELIEILKNKDSFLLKNICNETDLQKDLVQLLNSAIVDEPPAIITEGEMIKDGYFQELDDLRKISRGGKDWLLDLQTKEIERTKISSLKIKYNRAFGYYIEISKANLELVPENYIRKQTLVNAERFTTTEIKEYEERILGAQEKIWKLEQQLFLELVEKVENHFSSILNTANLIAQLDVLLGFAKLANENNYCQPKIFDNGEIKIKNGRHPVIEIFQKNKYVPNDLEMDHSRNEFLLLTGPNMSGKSSFLRQTALIVLLNQIGSFVPAESAEIGLVDRIFTRVGASDNLTQGVSTFMAEMQEASNILNNATSKSLLILDEIGRGTSTYDGVSIACAIMEYIHEKIKAKTVFATHYHELISAVDKLDRAENYCVAVSEQSGRVIFLHKIVKGSTSQSYGIEVAKLAGLPKVLTNRATEILQNLEDKQSDKVINKVVQPNLPLLVDNKDTKLRKELAEIKIDEITPLQALQKLAELKKENDL